MRATRRSATRRSATRRSATRRKTHKHKRSQHKRSQHKRSQHKRSQHKRSQHKRSKYRRNKRGGAEDCGQLYLKCLKKEESHGIYTPRPKPPTPPPRKKRFPPKEPIYEVPYKDETPYENASHKSSLAKPRVLKLSPNEYGFKDPRLQDRSEDV